MDAITALRTGIIKLPLYKRALAGLMENKVSLTFAQC